MAIVAAAAGAVARNRRIWHLAPLPRLLAYAQYLGLDPYLVRPKRRWFATLVCFQPCCCGSPVRCRPPSRRSSPVEPCLLRAHGAHMTSPA